MCGFAASRIPVAAFSAAVSSVPFWRAQMWPARISELPPSACGTLSASLGFGGS